MSCIFCRYEKEKYIVENEFAFAIYDDFPVNEGHVLIIPKRHFADFFDIRDEELLAIKDLANRCKFILEKKFAATGFNIGINIGADAGQTIGHVHVHLIPRFKGDVENPKGGIRHFKENLVPYFGIDD
ncbi:MAG: HIT family protein [Sarcina sp.]